MKLLLMDVAVKKVNNITIIELNGDLDSNAAQLVQSQILALATENSRILLDLSQVNYMSSAGLRLLLLLYRQIRDHVGHIAIVGLKDEVRDVMAITGFLDFFAIFDTRNAGMQALSA